MNMIDFTPIINAGIALCAMIVTAVLLPYLRTKLGAAKYEKLLKYARVAVEAAEQIFPATRAAEKKAYVLQYIKDQGLPFDAVAVDNAIEAAVLDVHAALYGGKEKTDGALK